MVEIIDGKAIAEKMKYQIKEQLKTLSKKPVLALVLVGNDPASEIYVRNKIKLCDEVGIATKKISLKENISEDELIAEIEELNRDEAITGVLVQLPLPEKIDEKRILDCLAPNKDVDCLNPSNFGKFCQYGKSGVKLIPATALAVMRILEELNLDLKGKNAVIVGASNIVGKPVSLLLLEAGATVSICHEATVDLGNYTKRADILITATGKKLLIKAEMISDGAVVIDIGISRDGNKLFGDVDFESVKEKASFITPVPGGVGPVTIAALLENVLKIYLK